MDRVLVISDNPAHGVAAEAALRLDGRTVQTEPTVERGLMTAREWQPSLLLLDLGIGLTTGGLAALLRDQQVRDGLPVIAIAAPQQLQMVGAGVDIADVILPPLDEDELRARVARVLWKRTGSDDASVIRRDSLVLDLERYTVTVDGEVVDLTYKEYELLKFLASDPGKPFTREALLNQVWGYDYYGGSRTVDVHVRRIRAKIERHEQFIETVRNVGYRFVDREPPPPRD
ncbi:MAG TPA: response regulator transcription factor [Dehalococcoidia bacterium]|nr:response regulator transcription factor [Dehalococcoidia bacterium]